MIFLDLAMCIKFSNSASYFLNVILKKTAYIYGNLSAHLQILKLGNELECSLTREEFQKFTRVSPMENSAVIQNYDTYIC